jgi:hypothetical protein
MHPNAATRLQDGKLGEIERQQDAFSSANSDEELPIHVPCDNLGFRVCDPTYLLDNITRSLRQDIAKAVFVESNPLTRYSRTGQINAAGK